MTDQEPTGAEIDERKWATDDPAWEDKHLKSRTELFILSYTVVFVLGVIVGKLLF